MHLRFSTNQMSGEALPDKCLSLILYVVPLPCYCRAEPNLIDCIQAKNNRVYLVRHGSSSGTTRRMNWALY